MPLTQGEAMRLLIANRAGLFAYLRVLVGDLHLAEDVLQQLSVILLKKHAQIQDAAGFLPWARRAARLEALYVLRQRHPDRLFFSDALYDVVDRCWERHDGAPAASALAALHECLEQLPEKSRRILGWRFTDGLECGEIASRLGQSDGAVYMAISRLYGRLGACIRRRLDPTG